MIQPLQRKVRNILNLSDSYEGIHCAFKQTDLNTTEKRVFVFAESAGL